MTQFGKLLVLGFVLNLAMVNFACSQKGSVRRSIKKGMCPLKGGLMIVDNYRGGLNGTLIVSKDSGVYAATNGKVESVFEIDGKKVIMLFFGDKFYSCSGLDTVFVGKGEQVKAGKLIGWRGQGEFDFLVSDKTGQYFPQQRYVECRVKYVRPHYPKGVFYQGALQ